MNTILHIFDLDDTLLIAPTFSQMLPKHADNSINIKGEFEEFFKEIKSFFYIVFSKEVYFVASGDFVVIYDRKTRRPLGSEYMTYLQDMDPDKMADYGLKNSLLKNVKRVLELHEDHIVFRSINGFHEKPSTVGNIVNDQVFQDYKNAPNKMILTGRNVKLKSFIEDRLTELSLELPNYGIQCFPGKGQSVPDFKVETILNTIKENSWDEIHFYEDRKDWLESAKKAVNQAYPEVKFIPHLITLSKQIRGL